MALWGLKGGKMGYCIGIATARGKGHSRLLRDPGLEACSRRRQAVQPSLSWADPSHLGMWP